MRDAVVGNFLHFGLSSTTTVSISGMSSLVLHLLTSSVQLFLGLPLCFPPSVVLYRTVFDRVLCLDTWPNHASFLLFTNCNEWFLGSRKR